MRQVSERPVVLVFVVVAVTIALMHWLPSLATAPRPPSWEEVAAGLDLMIWLTLLDELLDLAIELDSAIGPHGVIIVATCGFAFLCETARGLILVFKRTHASMTNRRARGEGL